MADESVTRAPQGIDYTPSSDEALGAWNEDREGGENAHCFVSLEVVVGRSRQCTRSLIYFSRRFDGLMGFGHKGLFGQVRVSYFPR